MVTEAAAKEAMAGRPAVAVAEKAMAVAEAMVEVVAAAEAAAQTLVCPRNPWETCGPKPSKAST